VSKPFYEITEDTRRLILELQNKAIELNLGNISFHLFEDDTIEFRQAEYSTYWELVVGMHWNKQRDIYKIINGVISYQYSEKD